MKLGIAIILLSTLIFVILMVVPDAITPLAPLFCNSGEHLTNQQSTYSRPGKTVTTDTFLCQDANGNQRDISGNVTGATIVSFMVFLFLGIGLTTIGGGRASRASQSKYLSKSYVLPTLDPDGPPRQARAFRTIKQDDANVLEQSSTEFANSLQNGMIRFGGQQIHVDDLKSGNYQINAGQGGKHTLADTLRQLKDANDQGLIDSDEYGRLRQEALDKLV